MKVGDLVRLWENDSVCLLVKHLGKGLQEKDARRPYANRIYYTAYMMQGFMRGRMRQVHTGMIRETLKEKK